MTDASPFNALRNEIIAAVDAVFDRHVAARTASGAPVAQVKPSVAAIPTLEQGQDPRNKSGQNLTERGVELLFRIFDNQGGYNRAAKVLGIKQNAAKNRKAQWIKAGGTGRSRKMLDIDLDS